MIEVKVKADSGIYWDWCCANLETGTWKKKIPIMGDKATYFFDNGCDATVFKLWFGI